MSIFPCAPRPARLRAHLIVMAALSTAALALGAAPSSAQSSDLAPPVLTAPVNDFANVISADAAARLDQLIRTLQAASGDVIVVATVKTFAPAGDIRTYATEMFENHGKGIGQKGRDNGLLVLLAVDDREVWTEVGYDLEGIITDGVAGATSRQEMVPRFRGGDYGAGLLAGVTIYAHRIAEARGVALDGVPAPPPVRETEDGEFPLIFFIVLAMVGINVVRNVLWALTGRSRRGRRRWGGMVGPFGAGYGGWHAGHGSWGGGGSFGGGFGGFGGGRSGGGGGGASW